MEMKSCFVLFALATTLGLAGCQPGDEDGAEQQQAPEQPAAEATVEAAGDTEQADEASVEMSADFEDQGDAAADTATEQTGEVAAGEALEMGKQAAAEAVDKAEQAAGEAIKQGEQAAAEALEKAGEGQAEKDADEEGDGNG